MTDANLIHHILETAERNERISREILWARRLIWLIMVAAFAAGYLVRGIVFDLLPL